METGRMLREFSKGEEMRRKNDRVTKILGYVEGIYPIVEVEDFGDDIQVRFWCQWCRAYHYHGRGGEPEGAIDLGHRAADCDNKNPLSAHGYYLRIGEKRNEINQLYR